MAVKLIDLQLIYGVAGAREKFEDLASQLVKGEQPDAGKVRIVQGDGGIDVHVGELSDPAGIDVYQCKFFPQGLGESQKDQIRESFHACAESKQFKTRKWILCLPVDLSSNEKNWFEGWRKKQSATGIIIEDVWGALKLEGLLYQSKNRGLKEAFFKEEHLGQIRELHGLLVRLLPDITERLRLDAEERQSQRATEARIQQGYLIQELVHSAQNNYEVTVDGVCRQAGHTGPRPGNWQVTIQLSPGFYITPISSLSDCWSVVEKACVGSNGWRYPVMRDDLRKHGADWIGATRIQALDVESWRMHQNGLFVHFFPIWDDVNKHDRQNDRLAYEMPKGFVPHHFLHIDVAIRALTHIFRFSRKLAEGLVAPSYCKFDIGIAIRVTLDRMLIQSEHPLPECYRASLPFLINAWSYTREELDAQADSFAITAAVWFFERFGWLRVPRDELAHIQTRIFSPH